MSDLNNPSNGESNCLDAPWMPRFGSITRQEDEALQELEERYRHIRLWTRLVANRDQTGLLIWGPGGCGKSFQVIRTLEHHKITYRHINTRLSGPGIFDELHEHPDGLFLLEDVEDIFTDRIGLNLFRAALWGQQDSKGRMVRKVGYTTGSKDWKVEPFDFTGGIIFTSNRPLGDVPELRALETRIQVFALEPTREQLFALARTIALLGYKNDRGSLNAETTDAMFQYWKEILDTEYPDDPARVNLRELQRAYNAVIGAQKIGFVDWKYIIRGMLDTRSGMLYTSSVGARGSKRDKYVEIARDIESRHGRNRKAAVEEWTRRTGLSGGMYYHYR